MRAHVEVVFSRVLSDLASSDPKVESNTAQFMDMLRIMHSDITGVALKLPEGAAPTPVTLAPAHTGAARPTMTARLPVKLAAQAEPSLTQMAKEGVAKVRQGERRQQILEEKMEQDERRQLLEAEMQQLDAEAAADLSGNDKVGRAA